MTNRKDLCKDGVHISRTGGSYCLDCGKLLKAPPTQIREAEQPKITFGSRNLGDDYDFSDLPPEVQKQFLAGELDAEAPVGYGKPKNVTDSQRALKAAEYKQLLSEIPEKRPDNIGSSSDDIHWGMLLGYNEALDQCRAIIQKHIEEME